MLLKPKQLQGTAYMWRELFLRLEGFECFIQSFQFLCLDVSTKYGRWLAYCQISKTLFLHDLLISITTKLFFQVNDVFLENFLVFLLFFKYFNLPKERSFFQMLIQLAELNMLQEKQLIDLSSVECYYEVDVSVLLKSKN